MERFHTQVDITIAMTPHEAKLFLDKDCVLDVHYNQGYNPYSVFRYRHADSPFCHFIFTDTRGVGVDRQLVRCRVSSVVLPTSQGHAYAQHFLPGLCGGCVRGDIEDGKCIGMVAGEVDVLAHVGCHVLFVFWSTGRWAGQAPTVSM